MRESNILVTNVQRFSLHDGPGIRTTVFLKGCPLRCPWCSNPENLTYETQNYEKDHVSGIYGTYYTAEELYTEIIKDRQFYAGAISDFHISDPDDLERLPGGVTFSGGEALGQGKRLEALCKRLRQEQIHMTVETSLFISPDQLDLAMSYMDLFYVDMKILDKRRCKEILNGEIEVFLANLSVLSEAGVPVVIRVPVIGGYTDEDANREEIIRLISKYRPLKVELIKEHNLGASKYKSLGLEPLRLNTVTDEFMEQYKTEVEKTGVWAEVCKV